jgi:hypothetical protein
VGTGGETMRRPVGVTILAVLSFLTALGMLFFFLALKDPDAQAKAAEAREKLPLVMGLGVAAPVILLVFAGVYVAMGVGLLKLRNWARILTIILTALDLLDMAFRVLKSGAILDFVIYIAVNALILWYMFRSGVKQAFGAAW